MRRVSVLVLLIVLSVFGINAANIYTYIPSDSGNVAVKIVVPDDPRYQSGAPIVIGVSCFFTSYYGYNTLNVTTLGAISISYLWPGISDAASGTASDGTFDYGGPLSLSALRDVIKFACGELPDTSGKYIDEISPITPLTNNVGLFAFSHEGIAATNVLAYFGDSIPNIKYFVGRENPTHNILSALEVGHWNDDDSPAYNPYYTYPDSYADTTLNVDYSTIGWIQNDDYPNGRPYFGVDDGDDFILSAKVPSMLGKRFYSIPLIHALHDNNVFDDKSWPEDLATVDEVDSIWPYRQTIYNYSAIGNKLPDLKVMLIFNEHDHVQSAIDKPHIHQAYNGFKNNNIWVRLNPDRAYVNSAYLHNQPLINSFPDNFANTAPTDWTNINNWAYPDTDPTVDNFVVYAGIAEMMDRSYENNWNNNLTEAINEVFPNNTNGISVHIPSPSAGTTGIFALIKKPINMRFDEYGAPIAILVAGGWDGNGVGNSAYSNHLLAEGFITIEFNFPGSGNTPATTSGGIYDLRGENCSKALRDVIKFAIGSLADTDGDYLHNLVTPIVPMYTNVGLIGLSNGGNITITTAGSWGASFPNLKWILNWESPVGDGMPDVECGCVNGPVGHYHNPVVNPAYNEATGEFDYTTLKYDDTIEIYSQSTGEVAFTGGLYFDINENGVVDYGTDFVLSPIVWQGKAYYSVGTTTYAMNNSILPYPPTSHTATAQETNIFWHWRNGEYWIDNVVSYIPDIRFMIIASTVDHVQAASNHPHILVQYNGFIDANINFARVNPDRSYVEYIAGDTVAQAVDNDAFQYFSNTTIANGTEPETVLNDWTIIGGACELADRTFYNNNDIQLDDVITDISSSNCTLDLSNAFLNQNYPNPFNPETEIKFYLPMKEKVSLSIYNIYGEKIKTLYNGFAKKGINTVIFNAQGLANGIYFYKLTGNNINITKKMILLK